MRASSATSASTSSDGLDDSESVPTAIGLPSRRYAAIGGSSSPMTAFDRGHRATVVRRSRRMARSLALM